MDNLNEQTIENNSQPLAKESDSGEKENKVSLGKFKDVNALLDAYNSLQAEFTKRCQKLKEYEDIIGQADKAQTPANVTPAKSESFDKEKILKDYIKEIIGAKQDAVILSGVGAGVKTPNTRPKTIQEAGNLAKELLTK